MKLNTLLLTSLLSTSLVLASAANTINHSNTSATSEMTTVKQEGMKYIKMLGGRLKSQLQMHIKADKTALSAMGFCSAKAEDITKEVNKKLPKYALVRRTALKIRNENNAPDALDIKVMEEYEARIAAKTFLPTDIKVVEEGDTTRIYKPLTTQGVCLKCHGSDISKEIQKEITAKYPNDKAVAFKEGSFRGVIVSKIKSDEK
ncbi:MAG: DUF3365 domain-containing protein [Sulfurovum sp.]|uniref:Tll0287-like domain-containing protein n=1 Tax=Sulfurovum sp. TaxID=1969726 RepID=UPI0028681E3E|nr:DUF3365 domain-containing protein [Sulfurovum sp.]MCO4845424.1 DUF3365 domain-containing protein [Sulfurovum sp.]